MKRKDAKLSIAFLFDDTLDSNDGVAQYVKRLGNWFSDQGHQVTYLVGESQTRVWSGGQVYSLSRNLKVKWGGNRLSISLIPKRKLINQVLADNQFDIVHVQIPYSPFMAQSVINRLSVGTALVGTFHVYPANKLADFGSRLLKQIYGRSLKRFDALASVSRAAQAYAKDSFGQDSFISPNVIDVQSFKVKPKIKNGHQIVFLGRLVKRKGAGYLIKAFSKIATKYPDVQLVIAGDGPDRAKLQRLTNKLGINSRVKFPGRISEDDKAKILASADIACFPALYGESFGIVLIEAMAAGAGVVIGGNNPGYKTVLENNPKALIDPRNTALFSQRLSEMLKNKTLANQIHKSQQHDVWQYDINKVGEDWLNVYRQLIAKRNQKRHN